MLTALVDKSLARLSDMQTQPGVAADTRFVMLEPIREYALEQREKFKCRFRRNAPQPLRITISSALRSPLP